jgi:hypothetical protein
MHASRDTGATGEAIEPTQRHIQVTNRLVLAGFFWGQGPSFPPCEQRLEPFLQWLAGSQHEGWSFDVNGYGSLREVSYPCMRVLGGELL